MERLSFNALEKKWQVAWLKTKPQYNTSKKKILLFGNVSISFWKNPYGARQKLYYW